MAKQRMINTKFWSDPWILKFLKPLDRYLFLYLLTNEHTNISGIYELSIRTISFDTGIEKDILEEMLPRLAPKIYYEDEWVILINFTKHQNVENEKILVGINRELQEIPDKVYENALAHGYPIYRSPFTKLNLTKLNTSESANASSEKLMIKTDSRKFDTDYEPVIDVEGQEVGTALKEKPNVAKAMRGLLKWAEDRRGKKFVNIPKQFKAMKIMRKAGISVDDIKGRWEELDGKQFYLVNGVDFMTVASSFDRK